MFKGSVLIFTGSGWPKQTGSGSATMLQGQLNLALKPVAARAERWRDRIYIFRTAVIIIKNKQKVFLVCLKSIFTVYIPEPSEWLKTSNLDRKQTTTKSKNHSIKLYYIEYDTLGSCIFKSIQLQFKTIMKVLFNWNIKPFNK